MTKKVIIKENKQYTLPEIEQSIREIFAELCVFDFLKGKKTVLLKPNLLGAHHPDKAVTTHPFVLEAVIRTLKDCEVEIIVGDSSGGTVKAEQVWNVTGLQAVCEKYSVPLVEFGRDGVTVVETAVGTLNFGKTAASCDVIINLPKMKTHSLMLYTGAVKNLFGTIAGLGKSELHKLYPSPESFSDVLTTIYDFYRDKVVLNILDGVVGMHGEGPSAGKPYPFGLIMASRSASAMDAVAAKMMGFQVEQIPYIRESLKIDNIKPEDIAIDQKWQNHIFRKVKINTVLFSNKILNKMPRFVRFVIKLIFSYYPRFSPDCQLCLICVQCCPVKALTVSEKKINLDKSRCIKCLCCHEMCPHSAISFRRKLFFPARRERCLAKRTSFRYIRAKHTPFFPAPAERGGNGVDGV
ncbi:MAG: DUF362 domain-containing protein [Candidatus Cloacimonetes bacterium]|nr:DUF362 domain-containing protein [Candidatus Cloacimonadota bacterium]